MTSYDVVNPATEQVVSTVDMADLAETDLAVERARRAFDGWRRVAPADRGRLLRRFAGQVEDHLEELAQLEMRNAGHPIGSARWEAGNVRDVLTYYSAAPERLFGRQIPVAGGVDITFHEPLGVVGVIVPWNFPMPIASWAFAPALAAGNTVVLKPAELTPLTALRLAELALEAGLPADVFTVLPGAGPVVGRRLVEHPDVRKIVFTGSTRVGKQVMAGCAEQVKRVTLELGGKSANVVFADADLEQAAASAPAAVFDNAGQDCCARSRILVERSVYDRFLELLEPAVKAVRVGDPALETSQMGPLISRQQRDRVASYVPEDAPVAFRGDAPAGPGFWFPPTVLAPVDPADRAAIEEIFGPVVTVIPFEDEAAAVRIANEGSYGLSGSIWTRDLGRALRVARGVEAGNLSVNSHSS
ncbi:MAG: 10-formyltetrahydrofolate dehydrogenase, partial [Frankiales bacterium]|nr:10-formyltetrahydrofolate dehydrogenase [Frankiales bacterium]